MMTKKLKVGVLGGTGMVGQRFVSLLENHPWFEVTCVAASPSSAGKSYEAAVAGRWQIKIPIPQAVAKLTVKSVVDDMDQIAREVDLVFSAVDMDKQEVRKLEEQYASKDVPVVSNNSAHRWTDDVPMIIPEVNPEHAELIAVQRKNRGWKRGLIAVKPNCSIQSYVPILKALEGFCPKRAVVTTCQAISGAGKTFETWPEMIDNVIPFIKGEEEKSEKEPLRVMGTLRDGKIQPSQMVITATCIRVPVSDGHMASVSMELEKQATPEQIIQAIENFKNPLAGLDLPSAPKQFMKYYSEPDRPQTGKDRDFEKGMGITVGRLRKETILGWSFVALSHNTIRGAAGGAILVAELLKARNYF